jgi:uncharacterized delta-60 repeat protein
VVNQTDDQLLIGGAFTNFNGTILNRIARLNTDGSVDSSFNPGAGADSTVYALGEAFIGGVRKIYLGGAFGSVNGAGTPFVARLNDDGTVDGGFNIGAGPNGTVYAVAVYPTNSPFAGEMLIGGAFTAVNNFAVGHLARLNANGSVDTNFDANLSVGAADNVRAIAIQSDGRVLVGGDFTNFDGATLNHLARLNPDGSLDTSFAAAAGPGANETVSAIAIQADNRIVVAGQFTEANGVSRNRITRLLPTGAVDPTINFGDGANGAVNAVLVQPADQMIVIGGDFTQYDDQPAGHVARIYGGSVAGSGAFTFSSPTYQVDENGIQASIAIRRVGGTSGTNADGSGSVFVTFATADGTARAGINYSNVSVQVGFPPGEVLKNVPVPVKDDGVVTNDLTVDLALSNPTLPAGLGDQHTAVLNIVNDDSAVRFGSATYSVPKDILTGVATIDVARVGSASGTNSVDVITTTNGTAVPGVDFYPTNVTVTFGPGQMDVQVQVPILNNTNYTGNRTVIFGLSNAVNTLVYAPSNATLTIIDTVTSPGQLSFAATNFFASASGSVGYLTVARNFGSSGSVSVNFATVQGPADTAFPGVNYTAASGPVGFNDGQTNAAISVPLLNNNLVEGPVTLSVVLSTNIATDGATLVSPTNATLTILNTNVVIAFTAATNTFSESDGTAFINVARYNTTNVTTTVIYATADGTARSNVNYVATSGTLTFFPGESLATIPVDLIHDTNATGTLTFSLNLSSPGGGALLAPPSTTVMQETDAEAGLSFATNAVSVAKNLPYITIPVICANPSVEPVIVYSNGVPITTPLSVQFSTVDGTAQAGVDYTATNGVLVFTNSIGTNTFDVPLRNNTLVTGSRSFTVKLSNPTAPGLLVSPSNEVVTIVDVNSGLSFSSPAYSVVRSNLVATITVVRVSNTNAISTVNFATADGTAKSGSDYVGTSGTLLFTNGVIRRTFPVTLIPSAQVQPDKTVLLQLSDPTNGILIAPYAATLTIRDTSGSLVVPAGSAFAPNGDPNHNGLIDTNEAVSLLFAFRASGGNTVSNLAATLLATNGVTAPSGPQTYGKLVVNGPSVSRLFSFTAAAGYTNGQRLVATFSLKDGASNLGAALFTYTLGSWTTVFSNTNVVVISANGIATPYPSMLVVTNVGGVVLKAALTLTNFNNNGNVSAVDALLVSPAGGDTLLMGNAGGPNMIKNATLIFDDAATNSLPQTSVITNGTYKPTGYGSVPTFP